MAVNAKDFSAAFFHISYLKNANTRNNTAASKQPNLFWFWEKYHDFSHHPYFLQIHAKSFYILALEGPRE